MRQAIERFRTRMAAANRQFIQQRVDEIEARGLATEKEKLDRMRDYRYFEDLGTGGEAEWGTAETRSKANRIRQTTWLADVPTLENALLVEFDGLGLFFKYAQGVRDPDFRHSGIAPFEPGFTTGVTDRDLEGLDPSPERSKVQELLSRDQWYSAYLYCCQCVDDEDDEDDDEEEEEDKGKSENTKDALNLQDWAWRVIFFDASIENPRVLYGRKARFDSIPEFLDWYSSWLDHLDARGLLRLQRDRAGCETDCESDCELH
ncbi:hypothetical protein AARAC_000032 [Aspergillus arachidicola]|uniref:Uncharacterized protein n=1 Tax=Aspergillus arachidicola TaxID=656916 RepID=A0A2G7FP95_9EURO|nr:hypothetical protein AARAC_000032 [Aspergillus arachidicola]